MSEDRIAYTSDPLNYEERRLQFERAGFKFLLITQAEARELWRVRTKQKET